MSETRSGSLFPVRVRRGRGSYGVSWVVVDGVGHGDCIAASRGGSVAHAVTSSPPTAPVHATSAAASPSSLVLR